MSKRAELERRLADAAHKLRKTPLVLEEGSLEEAQLVIARGEVIHIALALADALRDEQRVGGRPWGGE